MISKDQADFTERTEDLFPLVVPEVLSKLVMLDNIITSGFEYLDYKSRGVNAQFLKWSKTRSENSDHRKRAQWLNDYRTLTLGVGREGATQAYVALELDPLTTLVVLNNDPRPRETMRANLSQISEAEMRLIDAEWFLTNEMSKGCHPLKQIVVYVDSGHKGVDLLDLIGLLESDMADPDTIRILVIQTA